MVSICIVDGVTVKNSNNKEIKKSISGVEKTVSRDLAFHQGKSVTPQHTLKVTSSDVLVFCHGCRVLTQVTVLSNSLSISGFFPFYIPNRSLS